MAKKNLIQADTFPHQMLKEIHEQPQVFRALFEEYLNIRSGSIVFNDPDNVLIRLKKVNKVLFLACGTSYHAGLFGKYLFSEFLGIEAHIEFADEFIARKVKLDKNTLVILLSQSGQTADVVTATRMVRRQKSFVLAVTNGRDSKLDKLSDFSLYCLAGEEKALAATKTYTAELMLLALFTLYFGQLQKRILPTQNAKLIKEIIALPKKIEAILKQNVNLQIIANKYYKLDDILVLGKQYQYPSALEAGLKLKETTYMHVEGFALGEFLHGPLAISDKKHPCLIFACKDKNYAETKAIIKHLHDLKKKVIAISSQGNRQLIKISETVIYIPKTIDPFYPLLSIIPIQLLAYHIAVLRGINPDKPRNLHKFVK